MPFGNVGSDSFEFYEGIRIVIPGALLAALGKLIVWTFDPTESLSTDLGTVLVAAIGLGLVAYFVDLPRQSAFYNKGLPSARFEELFATACEEREINPRNAFFVMSDEVVPSTIRARGLYSGSMFRIGFEAILFIGSMQVVPWLVALGGAGHGVGKSHEYLWWLLAIVALPILWPAAVDINTRYRGSEVRAMAVPKRLFRTLRAAAAPVKQDLSRTDVAIVAIASVLVSVGLLSSPKDQAGRILLEIGFSSLTLLWLGRFLWGGGRLVRAERRPFDRITILVLFLLASIPPPLVARFRGAHTFLDSPERVGFWLAAAALTSLLIASRGHEKRLLGGYSSQRAWFEINQGKVVKALTGDGLTVDTTAAEGAQTPTE